MFKLSASTTLILTKGEIDCWLPKVDWSGSATGTDKLSLNFSVMAFRCFKHVTQFLGCFKPDFMIRFSLSESSSTCSQLLTIPWFDLIRNFKKTGCKIERRVWKTKKIANSQITLWSPMQMSAPTIPYWQLLSSSISFLAVLLIKIRSHQAGHLLGREIIDFIHRNQCVAVLLTCDKCQLLNVVTLQLHLSKCNKNVYKISKFNFLSLTQHNTKKQQLVDAYLVDM